MHIEYIILLCNYVCVHISSRNSGAWCLLFPFHRDIHPIALQQFGALSKSILHGGTMKPGHTPLPLHEYKPEKYPQLHYELYCYAIIPFVAVFGEFTPITTSTITNMMILSASRSQPRRNAAPLSPVSHGVSFPATAKTTDLQP